jgi:hypothetical protein
MGTNKPFGVAMYAAYFPYWADPNPCKQADPEIEYQCAVRLSIALVRCGFTIRDEDFDKPRRIHRGRSGCGATEDHVCAARELEEALVRLWGPGELFRGQAAGGAATSLSGRWGIVYFDRCFRRSNGERGNHIDLWDGASYMNQLLHISGDASARRDLFSRANYVRFFFLPS